MKAGLEQRVFDRLDARLIRDDVRGSKGSLAPFAVGLSGGGDSAALLLLASRWAAQNGRRLLALTVDHKLNPVSADWMREAAEMARGVGAMWQGLEWTSPQGGAGVQARARTARHTLLAEAARQAGASVLLLGHTADDLAENHWMQAEGSTLGQLREWSPSPVWPEGRGIMLLRPLLSERRQDLRDYLKSEGRSWIDDPANESLAYSRIRARQALALGAQEETRAEPQKLTLFEWEAGPLAPYGVLEFERAQLACANGRVLATALLCASGHVKPPRSDRLVALQKKLAGPDDFSAVLSGARVEACGTKVMILREAGEMRREKLQPLNLMAGEAAVWDGRFEICASDSAFSVVAAQGHMSKLEAADRAILSALPPRVRLIQPILLCEGSQKAVLALTNSRLRSLSALRFRLNCPAGMDETTQEAEVIAACRSEMTPTALFSD